MYTHVSIYMYIYIYLYISVHIYIYIYICISVYIYIYLFIYLYGVSKLNQTTILFEVFPSNGRSKKNLCLHCTRIVQPVGQFTNSW